LIANGLALFISIDCGTRHIQHHTTAVSVYAGQSNVTYSPTLIPSFTTSVEDWLMACRKGRHPAANSARPRCGVLENVIFST
jgi:hypothetical protein